MNPVDPALLERLSRLLHREIGLFVRPDAWGILRLAIGSRLGMEAPSEAIADYLAELESRPEKVEELLPLVTVGKTSFFRDEGQFAALAELLPSLLARSRAEGRRLSIWSAGCSTGEEIWSLAIALKEAGAEPREVELLATDLNPLALAAAEAGNYRLGRTAELGERLEAHFEVADGFARVRPELRAMASAFRQHNLTRMSAPLPACGAWDLIFCRNVIIYFDADTARIALGSMQSALRPGGWLFLGYSESLFRLYDGFELTEVCGAFVYRNPEPHRTPPQPLPLPLPPADAKPPPPPPPPPVSRRKSAPAAEQPLERAHDLLRNGEFDEARSALEEFCRKNESHLAAHLSLAHLYVLLRLPDEAERCYEHAKELEPMRAETHLFFGIHRLARGDLEEARNSISRALYLDPDLSLGHYMLGRCLEKLQRPADARRCYRNATTAKGPKSWLGCYPDLPGDERAFARAAESALESL